MNIAQKAEQDLEKIRDEKPLIHNITNFVVMNVTANALLAMGASPVMAHAEDEVEDMVTLARALVLNIGTLEKKWLKSMRLAGEKANRLGIPVILDPVGSGATPFRTEASKKIMAEIGLTAIRGNASEILSLQEDRSETKGVDSRHRVEEARSAGLKLALEGKMVVAVTGKVDFITDGSRSFACSNGHSLLGQVTGTGCMATAVVAAFLAVEKDPLLAAVFGLAFFGLAGEWAAQKASSPGSFAVQLLDSLHDIDPKGFASGMKIEELKIQ